MKSVTYGLLISVSIIGTAVAGDNFAIDTFTLQQEALNKAHAQNIDYFNMIDLNKDGKLSKDECSGTSEGLDEFPFFDKAELLDMKAKIDKAFNDFDTDKDGYLNRNEATPYFSYIENIGLASQTQKMDQNHDGQITDDEMRQYMQSMPSLEDNIAKFQQMVTQQSGSVPTSSDSQVAKPEVPSDNPPSHTAKDKFSQMDKDHDDQVSRDEYVDYMYNDPINKKLGFTADDYDDIYDLIDKEEKGYISRQEYEDYLQKQLHAVMSNK